MEPYPCKACNETGIVWEPDAESEALKKERDAYKCAGKLILGHKLDVPWTEIDDGLEGYLEEGKRLSQGLPLSPLR